MGEIGLGPTTPTGALITHYRVDVLLSRTISW